MNKKTPIEMQRDRIIKVTRATARLRASLAADEEINDILPDRLDDFDKALQNGELKGLLSDLNEVLNATGNKSG